MPTGKPREPRTGAGGFELAILGKGFEPANKATPVPVLGSLCGRWAGGKKSSEWGLAKFGKVQAEGNESVLKNTT